MKGNGLVLILIAVAASVGIYSANLSKEKKKLEEQMGDLKAELAASERNRQMAQYDADNHGKAMEQAAKDLQKIQTLVERQTETLRQAQEKVAELTKERDALRRTAGNAVKPGAKTPPITEIQKWEGSELPPGLSRPKPSEENEPAPPH